MQCRMVSVVLKEECSICFKIFANAYITFNMILRNTAGKGGRDGNRV